MTVQTITADNTDDFPLILALNKGGEVLNWITWKLSAEYASKDKILWSMGEAEIMLRGGTNARTGMRSVLSIDTIVALDTNNNPWEHRRRSPQLTNRELFRRDQMLCGYCGNTFSHSQLTRDHVLPRSKGGKDIWENVVTSCRQCNQKKDARTPEQAGMPLIYVPYVPSYHEALISRNRKILADQMEYLMKGVSKESRLHQIQHQH